MNVFVNPKILKILAYYKNIWALNYVSAVSHWDLETYMPPKGAHARGEALAKIATFSQKIFLDKEFVGLIHTAGGQKGLTDAEKGIVRVLTRQLKFYEKLPAEFLEDFEKLTNTATVIWRSAKEKNEYKLFEPHLAKIFEMNKRMAEYLGYTDSPYDALMDLYEEGLTVKEVEPFFTQIREPLKNLLGKITQSAPFKPSEALQTARYDKEKLAELNNKVLALFWKDFGENFRLDISSHPFTTSFNKNDTRITTWYHDADFARSLLATVHEFGHALYDMQCADELEMTPIGGGSSLVIHESQSRFWENFIGRSRNFIDRFLPDMEKAVGKKLTGEEVLAYFNKITPGPLRVEADEVTCHFHIMLRYEIEKGMIDGTLKFAELRDFWNGKMQEYLGITPGTDSDGVLQDIHWSGGMVGYFPTYSLGTFLGAQWESEIDKSTNLQMTNLGPVKSWLEDHIHKFGSTYKLQDLLQKNGIKFDPTVNLKYLQDKYCKIYNLGV